MPHRSAGARAVSRRSLGDEVHTAQEALGLHPGVSKPTQVGPKFSKAASLIQSIFRGRKERKRMRRPARTVLWSASDGILKQFLPGDAAYANLVTIESTNRMTLRKAKDVFDTFELEMAFTPSIEVQTSGEIRRAAQERKIDRVSSNSTAAIDVASAAASDLDILPPIGEG